MTYRKVKGRLNGSQIEPHIPRHADRLSLLNCPGKPCMQCDVNWPTYSGHHWSIRATWLTVPPKTSLWKWGHSSCDCDRAGVFKNIEAIERVGYVARGRPKPPCLSVEEGYFYLHTENVGVKNRDLYKRWTLQTPMAKWTRASTTLQWSRWAQLM